MNSKMFQKGERVVYKGCGICTVEDIRPLDFTGTDRLYYVLKQTAPNGTTAYVPVDGSDSSNIRYIMTRGEVEELLNGARGAEPEWENDRKVRIAHFREILGRGDREELLMMVCCISCQKRKRLSEGKKLADTDEAALAQAEKELTDEFCISLTLSPEETGKYIREAIGIE